MKENRVILLVLVTFLLFGCLGTAQALANPSTESPISSVDTSNVISVDSGTTTPKAMAPPVWPITWTPADLIDTDPNEDGTADDDRDVWYAYYKTDADYLYFRLELRAAPSFPGTVARYKWFIDTSGCDLAIQGGNFQNAEYMIFVEDHDNDNNLELYLLHDINNDGNFSEWEKSPDYYDAGEVSNPNVADFNLSGVYMDRCLHGHVRGTQRNRQSKPAMYNLVYRPGEPQPGASTHNR